MEPLRWHMPGDAKNAKPASWPARCDGKTEKTKKTRKPRKPRKLENPENRENRSRVLPCGSFFQFSYVFLLVLSLSVKPRNARTRFSPFFRFRRFRRFRRFPVFVVFVVFAVFAFSRISPFARFCRFRRFRGFRAVVVFVVFATFEGFQPERGPTTGCGRRRLYSVQPWMSLVYHILYI